MATSEAKATSMIVQRAPETYDHSDTPPQKLEWIDVSDDRGNFELPLIQVDTSLGGGGGSIQQASRVLKVPKFSTRWMRLELSNDGTYGCLNGVGLRQLKAFCSPVLFACLPACMHTCIHTYACMHAYLHTYICMHACIPAYIHMHACMHTCIHCIHA